MLAVARKNVKKWADLIAYARTTAGTLYVPVALGSGPRGDLDAAVNAGCDVLRDLPEVKTWLAEACFAPLVDASRLHFSLPSPSACSTGVWRESATVFRLEGWFFIRVR